ncbi:MAG: hypothetical protein JNJ54_21545 [Myxococcaceae bacterium]|nr:hypothetical protein [Myxococcaceae bacterium]
MPPPELAATAPTSSPERAPSTRALEEDSTAEEVRALSQATDALRAREFDLALRLAHTTRVKFPRGVLHAELTLVEVDALCQLGRADEARDVADGLTSLERTGLVLDRLGRSCAAPGSR